MTKLWTTSVGAWGDSLCAYGNICKLLRERNEEKANVVYFGYDQNVCEFFKAQPNIDKVSWLKIDPPSLLSKYQRLAVTDVPEWLKVTELKEQLPDIVPTHITHAMMVHNYFGNLDPYRNFDAELPPVKGDWDKFFCYKKPFLLFQPYSTQSCDYDNHWPHWKEALDFILETTDKTVVMAGEMPPKDMKAPDWFPYVEDDRVVNIVGQTQNMIDLLHIATWADELVTTCNALAYWSIIKNKPAVVCYNKIIKPRSPFYYDWIKHEPNKTVDFDEDLDVFKEQFRSLAGCQPSPA